MGYRDPKKESDLFRMIEHQQSVLKAVKGINKLNAAIDLELFRGELESIPGALRACLRTDDSNGDGPVANHRPGSGQATQRTLQPRLQYGSLCLPVPMRGQKAAKSGQNANIGHPKMNKSCPQQKNT